MKKIKNILIACAFLFAFSTLSVNAQNPYVNAQIVGNSTISISSEFTCYDVPKVAGATYSWTNNFLGGLKTVCGGQTQSHIGYVSPSYHAGANIVWGHPVTGSPGWYYGTVPVYGWVSLMEDQCWIRCKVTYNGAEYFFIKEVTVQYY